MESSLHNANLLTDEVSTLQVAEHGVAEGDAEEHHIHLPNPSLWPVMLNVAIIVAIAGMLFIPSNPWITIIAAPFVLIGIMGWALEDPVAPMEEQYIAVQAKSAPSRFAIGQDVVDNVGNLLGTVQARFADRYILVEHGSGLRVKTYYVPQSAAKSDLKHGLVILTLSEEDLVSRGLHSMPDDLYSDVPEYGVPQTTGVPQFAQGPLSPAETGHYNYGRRYPGINTDASGSYHHEEVAPHPQKFVGERRKMVARKQVQWQEMNA